MRYLLTSLLCVFTLSLTAQETLTYPYNPDEDVNGLIASPDLLGLLAMYGEVFSPGEIQIDGVSLLQVIQDLQNQINNNALPDGIMSGDILRWNGTAWIPESPQVDDCGVPNGDNSSCSDCCGVPNGDGSTCDGDCGACNDNSTCLDECGVLNGDNASCLDECGVINGDNSTCSDMCGVPNGDNSTCLDCLGIVNGDGLVSHEGYDYSTVQIGDQCWFSENCRYLPVVSPSSASSTTSPYYYVYDYEGVDVDEAKATSNYETYGVLYNWPAVMTEGICPSGWHIPSDEEWQTMEISLGMSESEAAGTGWRGSPVGDYMKSTSGWNTYPGSGNGSNSSGFTGLPVGYRYTGGFDYNGFNGYWWTSSHSDDYSLMRQLNYSVWNIYRGSSFQNIGASSRCVKDYLDECGVLNGDNASCLDECGVPNGDNSCLDECGVPNGDNSTCVGCDGVPHSGLLYDECGECGGDNSICLDECGVLYGDNSTCLDECGIPNGDGSSCVFESCGDEIGHGNYAYSTVQIGGQCWFSENCRYLSEVSPSNEQSYTDPYYYVYGYEGTDVAAAKATTNYETYGVLYNLPAFMTDGICPSEWHVASDGEFTQLTNFLGGASVAGVEMKDSVQWNGNNYSGFTGLPGGIRNINGFSGLPGGGYGGGGYWWSSSASGSSSWSHQLSFYDGIGRAYVSHEYGFSARCVRD